MANLKSDFRHRCKPFVNRRHFIVSNLALNAVYGESSARVGMFISFHIASIYFRGARNITNEAFLLQENRIRFVANSRNDYIEYIKHFIIYI